MRYAFISRWCMKEQPLYLGAEAFDLVSRHDYQSSLFQHLLEAFVQDKFLVSLSATSFCSNSAKAFLLAPRTWPVLANSWSTFCHGGIDVL
jgi:hypothetical protein